MEDSSGVVVDDAYEFSAPMFFDLVEGESEEDVHKAELWFENALSYAPSPFMPRIKTERSVKIESLCNFSEADQLHKSSELPCSMSPSKSMSQSVFKPTEISTGIDNMAKKESSTGIANMALVEKRTCESKEHMCTQKSTSLLTEKVSSLEKIATANDKDRSTSSVKAVVELETCTPKLPAAPRKGEPSQTELKKHQTAKKIASLVKNSSAFKPKNQCQLSQPKGIKPSRDTNVRRIGGTPNFAQENQAIKRQKLEGGGSKKILNMKPQILAHKTRGGQMTSTSNLCPSSTKSHKEDRKVYVREAPVPFVSMAEMIRKFQSNTREDEAASIIQRKPKLTLTRPKEPEFETAQRARPNRLKSSAELEEEMMAKVLKFKARPLNKKILEAPTLPSLPRSTPKLPEFQEFHLETMARANQNAETSTVASTESSSQNHQWRSHITEPKAPVLQTALRARPPRVKSSNEIELEELEKAPKFKARLLNKKIFESKGDLGMFCNAKRNVTIPQEFHFAIDERIPPPSSVADLFDKLSLNSAPCHDSQFPRVTTPNPFHLHTEERGAEKERKFAVEVMHKQLEEERARVPKANPYPYTTDYPVLPPRPEPKQCTKSEPFQLASLLRHEEEMQREMEERQRMEKEAAQRRIFRAQPVLKEDPIPIHEKVRKPLTDVQEFDLYVDQRAADRAEFDKKIKEKEMKYKRHREECESMRMMEEEKALKQLRKTMVPHARPVPKFNHPFLPQKSTKETTKAKSPNLLVVQRKERQKMMATLATATSSPAANMR